ncbi:MAG: hypothetical protein Q8L52_02545 [bacterium]|nr:hypothetical protein [bacterium]
MWIKAMHPSPGEMIYFTLDSLRRPARRADQSAWGVHEHEGSFWVGDEALVGGKKALRLPLLDILEKRDEQYPDRIDEEVYLLFGLDTETDAFKWFLLNKEEFDRTEAHYKRCS